MPITSADADQGAAAAVDVPFVGRRLLADPRFNKDAAFTPEERETLRLRGLLPATTLSLQEQVALELEHLRAKADDLERFIGLIALLDRNETLFYRVLIENLHELIPIIYTPVVGRACQMYSHIIRRPRGVWITPDDADRIPELLRNSGVDEIRLIVATDNERILGLGDQGAGGMGIPVGKTTIYCAAAGIEPRVCLPISLDVGTDNAQLLADPFYSGYRHRRLRGEAYAAFIEAFVEGVRTVAPRALLQWEDFNKNNAFWILDRYRKRLTSFNDDIQGTAAVAAGTLLAAIHATGGSMRDQRIVIFGAGTAGIGIGNLLLRVMVSEGVPAADARRAFYAVDRPGLLVEDMPDVLDFQRPFAQSRAAVAGWSLAQPGHIGLLDVMNNVRPTTLIGVSGQTGAFSEPVIRAMARGVARPVVFPLSNPTSRSEATPQDLSVWTEGRAIVGTGSPFPPVIRDGKPFKTDQTNNSYIFPGVGLGVLAVGARRVTDGMFEAAARALAAVSPARRDPSSTLLPPVTELRSVARSVAQAVARTARSEGQCPAYEDRQIDARIHDLMWRPMYQPYRYAGP